MNHIKTAFFFIFVFSILDISEIFFKNNLASFQVAATYTLYIYFQNRFLWK